MLKGVLIPLAALGAFTFGAKAESPTVAGPITATAPVGDPSHQYPFFAALEDLTGCGKSAEFGKEGLSGRFVFGIQLWP